jgi:hypothetical protein
MQGRNENGKFITDGKSNMDRVLKCLDAGMRDRDLISVHLGITRSQVAYAIRNLWAHGKLEKVETGKGLGRGKGQEFSVYAPKPTKAFSGVSFIFGQL